MNISKNLTHVLPLSAALLVTALSGDAQIEQLKKSSDKAERLIYGSTSVARSGKIEQFTGNTSASYEVAIASYKALAARDPEHTKLHTVGRTDVGEPLHVFIIDREGNTELNHTSDRVTLLINNGIHPGEPCGIDASIKLAELLVAAHPDFKDILDHVRVAIIPVYNVGGALNRGCCSRANQNGPEQYGFRGNARNLDLNRDFIKSDSHNARAFQELFTALRPHLFLDTHTSNGADYQYTMTMITTQPDKASEKLRTFIRDTANPEVFKRMEARGWGMTPYVYSMGRTPFQGIKDFMETPRYSTGYAALFNALGFTSETHMFKPFADRVESTFQFEWALLEWAASDHKRILEVRKAADNDVKIQHTFALNWHLDTTQYREIPFRGYHVDTLKSEVTGQDRIKYNREAPRNETILYYDHYTPSVEVQAPKAYIIPQAWTEVIELFQHNGVKMNQLMTNGEREVEAYHIVDYDTRTRPYEGHYLHSNVQVEVVRETIAFRKGDWLVNVNQPENRFIVETLEPQGVDSYFAWNYFDSILQQKEWFSDYVFEDKAAEMLAETPALKAEFEAARAADPAMAESAFQQLYWLYQRSNYYEQSFNRYPVYRVPASP